MQNSSIYYARVLQVPALQDTPERAAWEELVPTELDDKVDESGAGWYISDGDDNWESWKDYSAEYSRHNEIINKIHL